MKKINTGNCTIFFGGIDHAIDPAVLRGHTARSVLNLPLFAWLRTYADFLVFQHQVHGITGSFVYESRDDNGRQSDNENRFEKDQIFDLENFKLLERDGDWLCTNKKRVALAILTADCVPLVFYDPKQEIIAVAHAGWRGTFAEITRVVLEKFFLFQATIHASTQVSAKNYKVFIGPAAGACCYQVDQKFLQAVPEYLVSCSKRKDQEYYFDLTMAHNIQLKRAGVLREHISQEAALCTIHDTSYCSYRRQAGTVLRNITVIVLT